MKHEEPNLSHLKNTIEMHNNASFSHANMSKEEIQKQKVMMLLLKKYFMKNISYSLIK